MTARHSPRMIFMHIPKTGGLTLRHFLLRRYGQAAFDHYDPGNLAPDALRALVAPDHGENDRYLQDLFALPAERQAAIRVYTGHFSYGIHERLPGPSTYITLLRDPIDRVLSRYHSRRVQHGLDVSLHDFLTHPTSVTDQQTRRVAGGAWAQGSPDTGDMLEAAKQHLIDDFAVVGVQERWDEALLVLADMFGWQRPYYHRYNEVPDGLKREDLGADVLELLQEQNRSDHELHQFARERFEAKLSSEYPNIEHRVRQLQRANAVWQRVNPQIDRAKRVRNFIRSSAARTYRRVSGRPT